MKRIIYVLLLVTLTSAPFAFSNDFFVSVDGGIGGVRLNQKYEVDGLADDKIYTSSISANIGIVFDSSVVLGIGGLGSAGGIFIFVDETYAVVQEQMFVGYRFPVGKNLRITPNIGFTHWALRTEQDSLSHSDPVTRKFNGNDVFGQLNFEFPVSHLVTVFGSYTRTNYDFGNSNSLKAGVMFEFK